MSSDPSFRRAQVEAYEAVLKALSVVKLDWSNRKLLAALRKQLNITHSAYVDLLEKVLNDPEVKASKGRSEATGSRHQKRYMSESDNDTDSERDEDYQKEEEGDEESYSEGSTSRPIRGHTHVEFGGRDAGRGKKKGRKRTASGAARRKTKAKSSGGYHDSTPGRSLLSHNRTSLSHDDIHHYELNYGTHGGLVPLSAVKPPYEKSVFERYLLNGSLEELREMNRHIKKKRQLLINSMLDDEDDSGDYPEDDLVQKILLREKNARQEKLLEADLKCVGTKEQA